MPKSAKSTGKSVGSTTAKKQKSNDTPKARRVKQPEYKSFRLSKRIKQPKSPLPGSFRLFVRSIRVLRKNWRLYTGIVAVYLMLTIVLVKGFGVSGNIDGLKESLRELFSGGGTEILTSVALFGFMLGNANNAISEVAGAYQSILLIVVSLALIWALRHTPTNGKAKVTVRDAFYKGLYPLVPFLLVLIVVGIQFIPMLIAGFLYSTVIGGGIATTLLERVLWICLLSGLSLLTLYMITSSVFALYIVTLWDVTPMKALRSARKLVLYRRWMVLRRILFLPMALLVIAAIIMVPIIMISSVAAEWIFFVMSMFVIAITHSYMYGLYRELIKE